MILVWIMHVALGCTNWGCTNSYDVQFSNKADCIEQRDNLQKLHYQKGDIIYCHDQRVPK